jgi:hypothetical protein
MHYAYGTLVVSQKCTLCRGFIGFVRLNAVLLEFI